MAKPIEEAGNKASLRAGTGDSPHRINVVSGSLGKIADSVISTNKSIIFAGAVMAFPIISMVGIIIASGVNYLALILPGLLIVIGSVLFGLNFFFINPSQGLQAKIGLRYWRELFSGQSKKYFIKATPYRFVKADGQKASLEGMYKGRHRFIAIAKVHGSVTQTAFDSDLAALRDLNYASIRALDRNTIRTTVNAIGVPKIEPKPLAANATEAMKVRRDEITRGVRQQGRIQTLDSYIMLDAPSWQELQKKLNNQITYWNNGLVVTAQILQGKQLKQTMDDLFA